MPEKIAGNIKFPATIKEKNDYSFGMDVAGLYSVSISARVKSGKQINSTDDEDLQIEIDGRKFSKIPNEGKPQYKDIAPAFNGSDLKGLKKTVVFFIWLDKGSHTISLIPDNSAHVENIDINKIEDIKKIDLEINEQAQDGDRRSWFTFVFINLAVKELYISIITESRWFDRDDAQIKIDGEIQSYKNANFLHRFWYWIGSLLKGKEETAYFNPNLSEGQHYIEINADRMPILNRVVINLGDERENQEKDKIQKYDQFHGISGKEDYDYFDDEIIGNTLWKKTKEGFSLIWIIAIICIVFLGIIICCYAVNKLYKSHPSQKDQISVFEEEGYYDSDYYIDYSSKTGAIVEKVFLENLKEYKKDQYNYGSIFDETVKECRKRRCWMEGVVTRYYDDLIENMKSNKQFLDAVRVFDFLDPKVGDIDNDGENEIVFVQEDIQNHDFVKVHVIDKIDGEFKLMTKEIDAYDGRIELRDMTGDLIPEIIFFITFGRYGYPLFIYQYKNKELVKIFQDEHIEFPEYTFSDIDNDKKIEIKVSGEEHESLHDYRAKIQRVYEYNQEQNNFILIDSKTTEI